MKLTFSQGVALLAMNRLATDQRTIAERHWRAPTKARVAQLPADIGIFSDEAAQLDMVEMLQDPVEDE